MESPELSPLGQPEPTASKLVFGLPKLPGWRGELLILGFMLLVTLAMTWPIAISMDQATGMRGDYFNNIWNAWWVRDSIQNWHTPFYTEGLYAPGGLSLKLHTLSILNALPAGLLGFVFGPHTAFNIVLLGTFLFSAWAFSLFARYMTGSLAGAVLGGLVYSFNPFHYFYICQVNIFTWQYLPLAILFFVRTYREGGWRNLLLAGFFTGCIAASAEYFVVYAALMVGMLLVLGKGLDRERSWFKGVGWTLAAGLFSGVCVVAAAFPLIWGRLGRGDVTEGFGVISQQKRRANELFGYYWIGGAEEAIVSWPTMLGFSTLILLGLSIWRLRRQWVWLVIGGVFFTLSLGNVLVIGGEEQGYKLLHGYLSENTYLHGLFEMLRKPDRFFYMVQFVVALLVAEAWSGISERIRSIKWRRVTWASLGGVMMLELTGAPFERYDLPVPEKFYELAKDESVTGILELPVMKIDVQNARYNYFQTVHGKDIALGYCTALAIDKPQHDQMVLLANGYLYWVKQTSQILPTWIKEQDFERIVLYKSMPKQRPKLESLHGQFLQKPFFMLRRDLVSIRQIGQYVDQPFEYSDLQYQIKMVRSQFGEPSYEDDQIVLWDISK